MADHCKGPAPQTSQCSYYNPQTPKDIPNVTSEQLNRDLVEGDNNVEIKCKIESNPPACVTWLFNGENIQKFIWSDFYGATIPRIDYSPPSSTLKLYSIKPDLHRGQYTCHASNAIGQTNYMFRVSVAAIITFKCPDNKESAYLGSSFNITCKVYSNYPVRTVDYRRGGRRVEDDSRHELYQNPNYLNQFTMMIKNVSHEDAGTWELYAHNSPNHPEIKNITIQVVPCPRGFYCPLNESTPRRCPPRTYNDGTTNITYSCKACPNVFTSNKNLFPSGPAKSIEDCPKTDKPDTSQDKLGPRISAVVFPTALVIVVILIGLSCLRRMRRNLPWQGN
ncbi:myosin light chain kinase, smooth muscle [Exaiptasia diaphana]|uniref:Ig-like domain-containing protein n=1 Tax=Exaiptasia diaphana TaxID=2652724 RepID=A0A913YQI6_EXADI|nr:myosin light chain kinase, smooth muscle [Exaiptasia diaphana]